MKITDKITEHFDDRVRENYTPFRNYWITNYNTSECWSNTNHTTKHNLRRYIWPTHRALKKLLPCVRQHVSYYIQELLSNYIIFYGMTTKKILITESRLFMQTSFISSQSTLWKSWWHHDLTKLNNAYLQYKLFTIYRYKTVDKRNLDSRLFHYLLWMYQIALKKTNGK